MSYDTLISRLQGVRRAPAKADCARAHRACCPIHQHDGPRPGRWPSLSTGEKHNGGVLINCHRGCSTAEVVAAVGLKMSDLFPPRAVVGGKGNGGPAEWASAAALADALVDAAVRVTVGDIEQFVELQQAAARFKAAAWAAFRADSRTKRRAA